MLIWFFGSSKFSLEPLKALSKEFNLKVITSPDKRAGRGLKLRENPVKRLSKELNLPYLTPRSLKEIYQQLLRDRPKLCVVVSYGKIFPKEFLNVPEFGFLNLHPSLLPKYRGADPIRWALLCGEEETGVSVILLNEELDGGKVLAQERVKIEEEDNYESLSQKLSKRGSEVLVRTLKLYLEGKVKPKEQPKEGVTYAPKLPKSMFRLCWKLNSYYLWHRVRALYPKAYTYFKGRRVIILKGKPLELRGGVGRLLSEKKLVVGCGEGSFEVEELISPKGKVIKGEDLIRGYRLKVGDVVFT